MCPVAMMVVIVMPIVIHVGDQGMGRADMENGG
jgi:hypothetical protein